MAFMSLLYQTTSSAESFGRDARMSQGNSAVPCKTAMAIWGRSIKAKRKTKFTNESLLKRKKNSLQIYYTLHIHIIITSDR